MYVQFIFKHWHDSLALTWQHWSRNTETIFHTPCSSPVTWRNETSFCVISILYKTQLHYQYLSRSLYVSSYMWPTLVSSTLCPKPLYHKTSRPYRADAHITPITTYCITCTFKCCGKLYIGETTCKWHLRWLLHWTSPQRETYTPSLVVAQHFPGQPHSTNDMTKCIL